MGEETESPITLTDFVKDLEEKTLNSVETKKDERVKPKFSDWRVKFLEYSKKVGKYEDRKSLAEYEKEINQINLHEEDGMEKGAYIREKDSGSEYYIDPFKLLAISQEVMELCFEAAENCPVHVRDTIGRKLIDVATNVVDYAIEIKRKYYKKTSLTQADIAQMTLRLYLRYFRKRRFIKRKTFRRGIESLVAYGKIIGMLMKKEFNTGLDAKPPKG